MTYLSLFESFFQVGLFSIGGGLAALPLIQHQIVELHEWLSLTQFTDLITIAEMTPGPLSVNSATFVGLDIGGVVGAMIATAGCLLPSCIIVGLLAWVYFKYKELTVLQGILTGLRPAIVALIATAFVSVFILAIWGEAGICTDPAAINFVAAGLFACALFVLRKWKPSPIVVMLATGVIGGAIYLLG